MGEFVVEVANARVAITSQVTKQRYTKLRCSLIWDIQDILKEFQLWHPPEDARAKSLCAKKDIVNAIVQVWNVHSSANVRIAKTANLTRTNKMISLMPTIIWWKLKCGHDILLIYCKFLKLINTFYINITSIFTNATSS